MLLVLKTNLESLNLSTLTFAAAPAPLRRRSRSSSLPLRVLFDSARRCSETPLNASPQSLNPNRNVALCTSSPPLSAPLRRRSELLGDASHHCSETQFTNFSPLDRVFDSTGFDDANRFDRHLDAEDEQRYGGYESRSSGGFFDRKIGGGRNDEGGYYDSRYHPRVPNGLGGFSKKNNRMNKRPAGMMMDEDHPDLPNPDPSAVMGEMVRSIRMLGEGFVKMEKMKVDMVRDIERMRMEMEMKRSEMILESQQLIVNAFVEGLLGSRKKSKKVKLVD